MKIKRILLTLILSLFLTFSLTGCEEILSKLFTNTEIPTTQSTQNTTTKTEDNNSTTTITSEEITTTTHTHVFNIKNTDEAYLKNAATCVTKAMYYYSCSCGEHGTATFSSGNLGDHSYGDYVSNNDGTCTTYGTQTKSCSVCGSQITVPETTKKDHNFTSQRTTSQYLCQAADCYSEATYYYSCANCGAKGTETFKYGTITEHNYTYVPETYANQAVSGYAERYECSVCHKLFIKVNDNSYTQKELDQLKTAYIPVNELLRTANNSSVMVIGNVVSFIYDGTSGHNERYGFIIKDIQTNDTILVNGIDVEYGGWKDKIGTSIQIGQTVVVVGQYELNYNVEGTSQYYTRLKVASSSFIEVVTSRSTSFENLTSYSSIADLSSAIGSNANTPNYKIYKLVGTEASPIGFVPTTSSGTVGSISSKNTALFLGLYSDADATKVNGKQLVIPAKSLSSMTNIETAKLYSDFYNFSSNTPDALTSDTPEILYYTGTLYVVLSQTTLNNYLFSIVNYEGCQLTQTSQAILQYKSVFKPYLDEFNDKTVYSTTNAFNGGYGQNDILNYVTLSNDYINSFEIQNGYLTYVGDNEDEKAACLALEININDELNLNELATIATAYSYYYQGGEIEYDQEIRRRQVNISPESATAEENIYLDCSSFVNSVFYNLYGLNVFDKSLGYTNDRDIPTTSHFNYYANLYSSGNFNEKEYGIIEYFTINDYSIENKETIIDRIKEEIQVGDLINYRYKTSTGGHVIMYIGNETFMHCTGSSFTLGSTPQESWDKANANERQLGAIQLLTYDDLFTKDGEYSSTRYIFNRTATEINKTTTTPSSSKTYYVYQNGNYTPVTGLSSWDSSTTYYNLEQTADTVALISPLRNTKKHSSTTLTDTAIRRISLNGIEFEKKSNISNYNSVSLNDILTVTLTIKNNNSYPVTYLTIEDTVPENATLVSVATQGYTLINDNRGFKYSNITIQGSSTLTYSYQVKITSGSELELNNTKINGVCFNCLSYQVRNYTQQEIAELKSYALGKVGASYTSDMDFIRDVYNHISKEVFTGMTNKQAIDDVYYTDYSQIKSTGTNKDIVVKNMFGGLLADKDEYAYEIERVRYVKSRYLECGDVIVTYFDGSYQACLYIDSSTILTVKEGKVIKLTSTDGTYVSTSNKTFSKYVTGECRDKEYLTYVATASMASSKLDLTSTQLYLEQLIAYYKFVIFRPSLG